MVVLADVVVHPTGQRRAREGKARQLIAARVVSEPGWHRGTKSVGPALIEQSDTTTLLATDETAVVDDAGNPVVHFGS